jgi:hypothetical protein
MQLSYFPELDDTFCECNESASRTFITCAYRGVDILMKSAYDEAAALTSTELCTVTIDLLKLFLSCDNEEINSVHQLNLER